MLDPKMILSILCLYMLALFLIAGWVERHSPTARKTVNSPFVYSLSLAVYCTAWTYYGSVGMVANGGALYFPMYLGPTLSIFLWWTILRKLVRLKEVYKITSIADFLAARYHKSGLVAAIVTVMAILGVTPYVALQLKSIFDTFQVVSGRGDVSDPMLGPTLVVLIIGFSIALGVRRQDPTERHEGMVLALAVQCVVKLIAFLLVGAFVTWVLFDGFGDIMGRVLESGMRNSVHSWGRASTAPYFTWSSYFFLSMCAILFLPRQFHVSVVENSDERHILTAMWSLPLYMFLINIFIVPIAMGGLLKGFALQDADTFVLMLPMQQHVSWLALLVFIGGFSAAAGMITVSAVTMATMITNHLMLPLLEVLPPLGSLRRHMLACRWVAVAGFIGLGYLFEEMVVERYMLVSIGLISFAAVLQFAPAMLGGIFWKRGNRAGAIMGMLAGGATWCYTVLLPALVRSGSLPANLIDRGPWGIRMLKPEALFGLTGLDPISHTVLWSMIFNIGLYVLGSLYFQSSEEESLIAGEFVDILKHSDRHPKVSGGGEAYIHLGDKRREIEALFVEYCNQMDARAMSRRCIEEAGLKGKPRITITELMELQDAVEKSLSGMIGSAAAYRTVHQKMLLSEREQRDLSRIYGRMLADLRVSPFELKVKIDYHREREALLTSQARELETKVRELESEIRERIRAQEDLRESEARYRSLVETMSEGLEIEDELGQIVYVNDRLCGMIGRSRQEILGSKVLRFVMESHHEQWMEKMQRRARGEDITCELEWVRADGRQVCTLVSSVPLLDKDSRVTGGFTVVTDISLIKALERERSNLVSMFAHDMRSSISGIRGLGNRLLTRSERMEENKKSHYLRVISKEAGRLEELVEDFLEFSRLETGRFNLNYEGINLESELRDVHEAYKERAANRDIELRLESAGPLPELEADVHRIRRVFTNLLDNALKFTKEGGRVVLSAQACGDWEVVIRVTDDGIGIRAEELPYIFDIFHRLETHEKTAGHGIGLASVKAIVESHGGRIEVTSEPGLGSSFSIYLPRLRGGGTD